MADDALQLRDVVPVEPLLPDPGLPVWVWGLIAVAAVLIAVGILVLLRRKRRSAQTPAGVNPDQAYQQAIEHIAAAAKRSRHDAALEISAAIRAYLAKVCDDPSLYETHQEFLARHDALQRYPEPIREEVSSALTRLAAEKYARPEQAEPSQAWIEELLGVVEHLHQQRTP